jgi:hypothetical protein
VSASRVPAFVTLLLHFPAPYFVVIIAIVVFITVVAVVVVVVLVVDG